MTTALYVLRAVQIGLKIDDLEELDEGFVMDMMIESANDKEEYRSLATQADFDRF